MIYIFENVHLCHHLEEGTGNGGPREPAEDSPQATGDKRLWRKWIEDRLAHCKMNKGLLLLFIMDIVNFQSKNLIC